MSLTVIFVTLMNLTPIKQALGILLVSLLLLSCDSDSKNNIPTSYIGGKIVNPKVDFVVLSKGNCVLDTVPLDAQNFFMYDSSTLEAGLYFFQHYEYQSFYLTPGDSLLLRVNTMDFDESLTYSGKGAEKNNLLMDFFLMNENEEQLISNWYHLSPAEYEQKIDSLQSIRQTLHDDFVLLNDHDEEFHEFAAASMNYDYFTMKEYYAAVNIRNGKGNTIPEEFYNFRKNIDYDNEDLRFYYPYYNFFNPHFDNLVYQQSKQEGYYNKRSLAHNTAKLDLVSDMVTNDSLKNSLLRSMTRMYLLRAKNAESRQEVTNLFLSLNNHPTHHQEINQLSQATISLTPGKKIPNLMVICPNNEAQGLTSIINKPTVFYFWSSRSMKHYKDIHTKAAELRGKYPEYDFIGINTDTHFKKWRAVVHKAGFNKSYEYQFDNITEAQRKLVLNSVNKAFIVDNEGIIVEGNTNLFNKEIESQLLAYLN